MAIRAPLLVAVGLASMAGYAVGPAAPRASTPEPTRVAARRARPRTREESTDPTVVSAHAAPERLRWVRGAELVLDGNLSCVDGRDPHGVLGTPGGDAGELLLALASVESVGGEPLSDAEVEDAVDRYLESFGRFYVHTDAEAVAHLVAAVQEDPRFAGVPVEDGEALIRNPPERLRGALLEHLLEPEAIGCGHLRLLTLHPDEYGVRPELTRTFLGAVFERLWEGEGAIDFVVLEGGHEEQAVVDVVLGHEVHAHTAVPALPPTVDGSQVFVHHPEAAAFLRKEIAAFLVESSPSLRARVGDVSTLLRVEAELGDRQLSATLAHLAPDLPIYELRYVDGRFDLRRR